MNNNFNSAETLARAAHETSLAQQKATKAQQEATQFMRLQILAMKDLVTNLYQLTQEQKKQNGILQQEIDLKHKAESREKRNSWIAIGINFLVAVSSLIVLIINSLN